MDEVKVEHPQAKALRKAKSSGLNDKGLASLLGVSTRSIEGWRSGDVSMPKSARLVCEMLPGHFNEIMKIHLEV